MKNYKHFWIIAGLISMTLLAGCRIKDTQLPTMNPTELSFAQTKFAYQQQTKAALLTQTRVALGGEIPATSEIEITLNPIPTLEQSPTGSSSTPMTTQLTPTPSQTTPLFLITPTPTIPQSLTMTSTPTVKYSQTPTRTTTVSTPGGWVGDWTAYLQQADGSYQTGSLKVVVNGEDITGELTMGLKKMTLVGKLYEGNTVISGIFSLPPQSGRFYWKTVGVGQFGGNTDNVLAFCAVRPGYPQPDPCGIFVSS